MLVLFKNIETDSFVTKALSVTIVEKEKFEADSLIDDRYNIVPNEEKYDKDIKEQDEDQNSASTGNKEETDTKNDSYLTEETLKVQEIYQEEAK